MKTRVNFSYQKCYILYVAVVLFIYVSGGPAFAQERFSVSYKEYISRVKEHGMACRGIAWNGKPIAYMPFDANMHRPASCKKLEICEEILSHKWPFGKVVVINEFYRFAPRYRAAAVAEAQRRGYNVSGCFQYVKGILLGLDTKKVMQNPLSNAFRSMPMDERKAIQEGLADLNFYTSTIDGLYGSNTEAAIKAFNAAYYDNIGIGTEALATILLKRVLNFNSCDNDASSCTDQQICRLATVWSDNQKSWLDGPYEAIAEERGLTCGLKTETVTVAKATNQVISNEIEDVSNNSSTVPLTIDIVEAFYKSEDYNNALTYASILAMKGNGKAHRVLGDLYANGRGVLQLNQNAYMWYNIAASHGDTDAMDKRDALSQMMTAESLGEAQSMALTCIQSNFKDCGLAPFPEQVKIEAKSPQPRPNNQPEIINGSEFQYSFVSQSTLRRKQLQYAFKQLGLYSSSIDGIWGRGTSQAITNYIKLNDLQPRNGEELYMDVLSKVNVPNSFVSNNARNVNRSTSNNAANRAVQQRQADMLINLGSSLMNSSRAPSSPSRSIDCYTYGNYTTCN